MISVTKAILTRMRALAAFGGRVYFSTAPAGVGMPYLVVHEQDSPGPDYSTSAASADEMYPYLFSGFGTDAAVVEGAMADVRADVEGTLLALDSGTHLAAYVGSSSVTQDPDRSEDGKEVWHGTTVIEFLVSRALV